MAESSESGSDEVYKLDTIVNFRIRGDNIFYEVKWKGLSLFETSWEAEKDLKKPENMVILTPWMEKANNVLRERSRNCNPKRPKPKTVNARKKKGPEVECTQMADPEDSDDDDENDDSKKIKRRKRKRPSLGQPKPKVVKKKTKKNVNKETISNDSEDDSDKEVDYKPVTYNKGPDSCNLCLMDFDNDVMTSFHISEDHFDMDGQKIWQKKDVHEVTKGSKTNFTCVPCNKIFATRYKMDQHKHKTHEKFYPIPCDHCDKKFSKRRDMLDHRRSIHTTVYVDLPESDKCHRCNFDFENEELALKHIIRVHDKMNEDIVEALPVGPSKLEKFECRGCGFVRTQKRQILRHFYELHLQERPIECDQCDQRFGDGKMLGSHRRTEHSKNGSDELSMTTRASPTCNTCLKSFPSEFICARHIEEVHGRTQEVIGNMNDDMIDTFEEDGQTFYLCLFVNDEGTACDKKYPTIYLAKLHKAFVHDNNPLVSCDHCSEGFRDRYQLAYHRREKHKITESGSTVERNGKKKTRSTIGQPETCGICKEAFENDRILAQHLVDEHSDVTQWMKDSDDSFIESYANDLGQRRFTCLICSKKDFESKEDAKKCRWSHKEDIKVSCDVCRQTFPSIAKVLKHRRYKHPPVQQDSLICPECGFSTFLKASFAGHMRRHREVFKCDETGCDAVFHDKRSLKAHLLDAHGIGIEDCQTCGITCTSYTLYLYHIKRKKCLEPERPFSCSECSGRFKTEKFLKAHHSFGRCPALNGGTPHHKLAMSPGPTPSNFGPRKKANRSKNSERSTHVSPPSAPRTTRSQTKGRKQTTSNGDNQSDYIDFNDIAVAEVVQPQNYTTHQPPQQSYTYQYVHGQASTGHFAASLTTSGVCMICDEFLTDLRSHYISFHSIPASKVFKYL